MKTPYLFPHKLKVVSGVLFVISLIVLVGFYVTDQFATFEIKSKVFAVFGDTGLLGESDWFMWIETSVLDEILMAFVIVFGLLFAFSKEKQEDELVASIRLHSLAWATIANYTILLLCYLFIYGVPFLNVLNVAMFSQLLIFIALFRYKMYRFQKSAGHEE